MKDGLVEILIGGSVGATLVATSWWVVNGNPGPAGGTAVMLALWAIMAILLKKQPKPSDEANEEIARLKERNAKFESAVETVVLTALVRELDRFESLLVELRKQADKVQP